MVGTVDVDELKFNGSNWQALNRIVALAKFHFTQDDDYDGNDVRKCAYLAARFEGPALDWAASLPATDMTSYDAFVTTTREAFGIAENNITALLRRDLDALRWTTNVPVFFAEFDRLTLALGTTSDATRIAMVESKLPMEMKKLLSEQALSFTSYSTMRERFNCMWAMNPTRTNEGSTQSTKKKPRCSSCGKKGHSAADCRGAKN